MTEPVCDGICVMAGDLLEGHSMQEVAIAHPGCPLHRPDETCGCGQRMCMDCGGPWCDACGERVHSVTNPLGSFCDACFPVLVQLLDAIWGPPSPE